MPPALDHAALFKMTKAQLIEEIDRLGQISSLRSQVLWFAGEMERKLQKHDEEWGTEGWRDTPHKQLLRLANFHIAKLWRLYPNNYDLIISAAADVANFCMMIAANALKRKYKENADHE